MSEDKRQKKQLGPLVVALACTIVLIATAATAQITTGNVAGSVKDSQGLGVPGATVTLISQSRDTRLAPVVTNATGSFSVPNVTADTYTVEVALSGFRTLRRPDVAVSPGDRVSLGNLVLTVGGTTETVTVTSEAPLLQAQSGERSFTVSQSEVENLPFANRSFRSLAQLAPGVTGDNPTRVGGGGQNNFMLDGASVMDTGNNGLMLQLNVDAIAEVKVLTGGYQAEFGRASGLQISAVTKSGSNRFHGSVYDVEQNSDWNANSWTNELDGVPKATAKARQFGYTIGGPVGSPSGDNKLFFFYSHEFQPQSRGGNVSRYRVPTQAERAGDFSASLDRRGAPIPALFDAATGTKLAGNVIPADRLYQPGLNILSLWPLPNLQQATGSAYNFEQINPVIKYNTPQVAVRGDYLPTSKLRFAVKWAGTKSDQTRFNLYGFDTTYSAYPWFKTYTVNVNYSLNDTTFIEGTYGYANRNLGRVPIEAVTNRFDAGLGDLPLIYPDANILPAGSYNKKVMDDTTPPFYVNGRAELPPLFAWGSRIGNAPPSLAYPGFLNTNPVLDISMSLTKVSGRHTIKGGFYVNSSRKNQNLNQRNALPFQGRIDFGDNSNNPLDSGFGFANAALGVFNSYTQQANFVEGKFVYKNIEGYLQDNWKVTPRLTLDYGIRLTHQQPQYDANGQASNFFIDEYNLANAPSLFIAACAGGVNPCSGSNRQAFNPVTKQFLGAGTAALIGQLVPNSGNLTNGIVPVGQAPNNKYNYSWPSLVISPRFGMALDLLGNQSMVLRGGVGLFVDRPDGDSIYYQSQNPPTSASTILQFGRLQTLGQEGTIATQGVPQLVNYRFDNPTLPSSAQWNAGLQMALPWSTALDVSYVGQHSYAVLNAFQSNTAVNVNAIDFGAAFLPQNQDPTLAASSVPGATALLPDLLRPIQGYSTIDQQWQDFHRTYHSVQASLNRRFRNGISAGGNWTLSLSDTGTTGVPIRLQHAPDGSWSIRNDQAQFNELMKNQGVQRHLISANFVWDLPDVRMDDGVRRVVGAVVNDWQLAGVLTAGSGAPYDATFSYDKNGNNINLTGSPDYAARIVVNGDPGSGCSSNRFQQFNTSVFAGPLPGSLGLESGQNLMNRCANKLMDLSVSRTFHLGGGRTVQVRADMFNAFNTVVFTGVNSTLNLASPTDQTLQNSQYLADGSVDPNRVKTSNAGFGAVTSAATLRAVQLQARFTF